MIASGMLPRDVISEREPSFTAWHYFLACSWYQLCVQSQPLISFKVARPLPGDVIHYYRKFH